MQHGLAAMALLTKQLIINPTEYMSRSDTPKKNSQTSLNNSEQNNQTRSQLSTPSAAGYLAANTQTIRNKNQNYLVTEL